jgi:hypothetical protein
MRIYCRWAHLKKNNQIILNKTKVKSLYDCLLVICWLSVGCLLAVCWLSVGCLLAVYWLSVGCLLADYWLSGGCLVAIWWLNMMSFSQILKQKRIFKDKSQKVSIQSV